MAAPVYVVYNAVTTALTSPMAGTVTSGTSGTVKTLLQIKPGSQKIRLVEWGYAFSSGTPSAPVQMELIETGTVFATVTSAGSVTNFNDTTGPSSLAVVGTSATGYNASAEGTITATRLLAQRLDFGPYYVQQWPLGREPEVQNGYSLRIRATPTSSAAVTVLCWAAWEE